MAEEMRDPREAVLEAWRDTAVDNGYLLSEIDADDPIRKAWPELVEALEACEKNLRIMHDAVGGEPDWDPDVRSTFEAWQMVETALTRARELNRKGGDHGE
jgi:hypothetical protein